MWSSAAISVQKILRQCHEWLLSFSFSHKQKNLRIFPHSLSSYTFRPSSPYFTLKIEQNCKNFKTLKNLTLCWTLNLILELSALSLSLPPSTQHCLKCITTEILTHLLHLLVFTIAASSSVALWALTLKAATVLPSSFLPKHLKLDLRITLFLFWVLLLISTDPCPAHDSFYESSFHGCA